MSCGPKLPTERGSQAPTATETEIERHQNRHQPTHQEQPERQAGKNHRELTNTSCRDEQHDIAALPELLPVPHQTFSRRQGQDGGGGCQVQQWALPVSGT